MISHLVSQSHYAGQGLAAPEADMREYASVAQVDAHRLDADQTGVARVSNARRDSRETAGYSRSHVAGMAAYALNALI